MLPAASAPTFWGHLIAAGAGGEVTSGSYSPSLNIPIALARASLTIGENCEVELRGRRFAARGKAAIRAR